MQLYVAIVSLTEPAGKCNFFCVSMGRVSAPGTARPGGRTARTAEAVFASTIGELRPAYADISVETIASRAGVRKTKIYRRWGSKAELVAQTLASAAAGAIEVPDAGRVESDLRALSRSVGAGLGDPRGAVITRGLLAGAAESAEIGALMDQFWAAPPGRHQRHRGPRRRPGRDPARHRRGGVHARHGRAAVLPPAGHPRAGIQRDADQAAAAALAAARAGVFTPPPATSGPGGPGPAEAAGSRQHDRREDDEDVGLGRRDDRCGPASWRSSRPR